MASPRLLLALCPLTALALGCGASPPQPATPPATPTPVATTSLPPAAAARFAQGLAAMSRHDRAGDWNAASCRETVAMFTEAAALSAGPPAAKAHYDAALVHQRCADRPAAHAELEAALRLDPKCHAARMHLALEAFHASGDKAVDAAIAELGRAALDSEFQNVEALVHLATLQLRHGDLDDAKRNLQRALAIDDGFLPAYNQLALHHLEVARRAGAGQTGTRTRGRADTQALELAALVCSQAIRRNPSWAPIHNTAGLIEIELGNTAGAVAEFNRARKLAPDLFEAHMNAAAVNLSFRGFGEAERAYRAAVALAPGDYDAHLGLSLALRGQIDESNRARQTDAAEAELGRAKKLAPDRAETYYNEAILRQEYRSKVGGAGEKAELTRAKELFGRFIQKAGTAPEYASAVQRSRERIGEIDQVLGFIP